MKVKVTFTTEVDPAHVVDENDKPATSDKAALELLKADFDDNGIEDFVNSMEIDEITIEQVKET